LIVRAVLFFTGGFVWLVGGNIIVARHYRRRGQPWWFGLRPWDFPFRDFSWGESAAVAVLAIITPGLFAVALSN